MCLVVFVDVRECLVQVRCAEVLSLSSLLNRYWVLLCTVEGLVGLDGSFGCSRMLRCGFVLQQQMNSDVKPRKC